MKTNLSPLRPAMTAIAASIALSSTPLFAQATDSATDQAAPVVVAPPPPTVTAPPAVAQAPAPAITTPAPTAPVAAPAAPMQTIGTPVVHEEDAAPAASMPIKSSARTAAVKHVASAPAARAAQPAAAPTQATATNAPANTNVAPAAPSVAAAKAVPSPAEPAAATESAAAPMPVATQTHNYAIAEEALPIAGGVGLAVIALGGAVAYGLRRRRREDEEEELLLEPTSVAPVARAEAEPAMVAPVAVAPAAVANPRALPNGFDISRFGRHTQAAYMGPTPDNPSYSLKRRLKRASFFDQREREAAAAGRPVERTPIAAPAEEAALARQDDGQVTVRLAPQRKSGGFGFAFKR